MHILHVIDELKLGGAGTHLATMVERARQTHADVKHSALALFAGGPLGKRLEAADCPVQLVDVQAEVRGHRYASAVGRLRAAIREASPDVVEAHLTWSRLLALRAAKRERVPVRVGYEQGDIYMRSPRIRLANFVLQRDAQRIVVCSNALRRWAHRTHGLAWDRLVVMHNSIDTRRFMRNGERKLGRFGIPNDQVIFVAVGTLGSGVNKRVDVCIDATLRCRARKVPATLVVCGDGPQRAELEARARATGDPAAVVFLGGREDVADILAECDVFCHGAPFEPFGIVCVEAMAAGLPVVVPDGGGMHEAVVDGITGFVYRTLDVDDLTDKMQRLATDAELRRHMGARGLEHAVGTFDMGPYLERLFGMYRELSSTARAA